MQQYHIDKPSDLTRTDKSFKFKLGLLNKSNNTGTLNVEITAPLQKLSRFWKIFEIPLVCCKINLILTSEWKKETTFTLTNKNLMFQL